MHGQNEESDDGDEDFAYGEFDASRVILNSTILQPTSKVKKILVLFRKKEKSNIKFVDSHCNSPKIIS